MSLLLLMDPNQIMVLPVHLTDGGREKSPYLNSPQLTAFGLAIQGDLSFERSAEERNAGKTRCATSESG